MVGSSGFAAASYYHVITKRIIILTVGRNPFTRRTVIGTVGRNLVFNLYMLFILRSYRVDVSQEAYDDMESLTLFIAEEKRMSQTSFSYMQRLKDTIKRLGKYPTSGRRIDKESLILEYGFNALCLNYEKLAIILYH